MPDCGTVSEISPKNRQSWDDDKIYLTFDIDWACDEVLEDAIDIAESFGVSATWFVTHDTPLLGRLRANKKFEIGIHPNFNRHLRGEVGHGESAEKVVDTLLQLVPEARAVRSHSVTQGSVLNKLFSEKGLTHESNDFIPERSGIKLKPWELWNGLIKVPYFWSDEVDCLWSGGTHVEALLNREGMKVFNFHPIHIFLNTADIRVYEQTRAIHRKPEHLRSYRVAQEGVRSKLIRILENCTCG